MKQKQPAAANPRLNRVGGEAVLEGVMMKAGKNCSTAVRMPNGNIRVLSREFHSVRETHKWLNIPILRGIVGFVETMRLSMSVLTASAEIYAGEEKESKAETWMKKHLGVGLMSVVSGIATLLGIALALVLFLYLPNLASQGIEHLFHFELGPWKAVTSGVFKILIFILYIYLVSLMPDIRRTFQYHGSEHKSIACFERGLELTPENAKTCTRFHPRCGTSFMFVMILLGILLSLAVRIVLEIGFGVDFAAITLASTGRNLESLIYTGIGLLLLPLVMGIGYEFLMYAGKHSEKRLVRILSAPGLWMQRLTTKEPSLDQLEVAIAALRHSLPDLFPDMDRAAYESENGFGNAPAADAANGQSVPAEPAERPESPDDAE